VKLKLDQVVIQGAVKHQQNANLDKQDYEKTILHGAINIMKAKSTMLTLNEIDIDKLISDGIKNP
jgi:hypothetical protein